MMTSWGKVWFHEGNLRAKQASFIICKVVVLFFLSLHLRLDNCSSVCFYLEMIKLFICRVAVTS